jgi:hypothetical protein
LLAPPHPLISTPSLSLIRVPILPRHLASHPCLHIMQLHRTHARPHRPRPCHMWPRCPRSHVCLRHARPCRPYLRRPCLHHARPHRPHMCHTRPYRPRLRHTQPRRPRLLHVRPPCSTCGPADERDPFPRPCHHLPPSLERSSLGTHRPGPLDKRSPIHRTHHCLSLPRTGHARGP